MQFLIVLLVASCFGGGHLISGESHIAQHDRSAISKIDLNGCGKTKGCYRVPSHCDPGDCDNVFTWIDQGDTVHFEVENKIHPDTEGDNPWTAVGYSLNTDMMDTSVVDCISNNSRIVIQMSYNPSKGHFRNIVLQPDNKLGLLEDSLNGSYHNGMLHCSFTRTKVVSGQHASSEYVANLTDLFYILLPAGPADDQGIKHKHVRNPVISPVKINLSEITNIGGSLRSPMIRAHGSLMIIAWMFVASLGILTSRYLKPMGKGKQIFGKDIWFQVHRALMSLTFCLTAAGFTIIFIKEKKLYPASTVHPVLGIIVMTLCITNPIMAVFRPAPDKGRRVYFNWAHFLVGNIAHIMAGVTMYVGVQLDQAWMPSWSKWLVLGFIISRILVNMVLTAERVYTITTLGDGTTSNINYAKFDNSSAESPSNGIPAASKVSVLTSTVLAIYALGVATITGVLLMHLNAG